MKTFLKPLMTKADVSSSDRLSNVDTDGLQLSRSLERSTVTNLNLCFLVHIFSVYAAVELFNAFSWLGANTLGALYLASLVLSLGLLVWLSVRSAKTFPPGLIALGTFLACVVVLTIYVILAPNGGVINADVARYHAPMQLLRLIQGDLGLYSSPFPEQILVISYFDNYNMAQFAALRTHAFSNALNIFSFALLAYNAFFLLTELKRGMLAALTVVVLLIGIPPIFGEVFIAKNNIFGIYLFSVSLLVSWWFFQKPADRQSFLAFGAWQGAIFGLMFLTKATIAVSLVGYVGLVCVVLLNRYWRQYANLAIAGLAAAVTFGILVLPYVMRQAAGLADAPSEDQLNAWIENWLFMPPHAKCGLYVWPQHVASMMDALRSYFGDGFDANITPNECIRGPKDRDGWRLAYYGEGIPALVTVLSVPCLIIAAFRRMKLELAVFGIALISLVVHQSFYANSVWNYRLVGITFFLLALGVALTVGRSKSDWPKAVVLALAGVWSAYVIVFNWSFEHGLPRAFTNVQVFGELPETGEINIRLHDGTRSAGYYALREILERVHYDWSRLNVVYGNEFGGLFEVQADAFSPTHEVYCFGQQNVGPDKNLSPEFRSAVPTDRSGCHIVPVESLR